MGFNTVAFLLNDYSHSLEKCPRTVIHKLIHGDLDRRPSCELAKEFKEPLLHHQALEVFPAFHADHTKYFRAGQNCCVPLEVHETYRRNGKKYIVLEAPEWDK